jgi:hypothetical protein
MDQSRLIISDEDTRLKNLRPFVRRILCVKLTVGKDADHGRGIPVDKITAADANVSSIDTTCRRPAAQPFVGAEGDWEHAHCG